MRTKSPLESEIAALMVSVLNLQDFSADKIDPNQVLNDGDMAMDSIDVLELSLAISKKYEIQLESEDVEWRNAFVRLKALAELVETLIANK